MANPTIKVVIKARSNPRFSGSLIHPDQPAKFFDLPLELPGTMDDYGGAIEFFKHVEAAIMSNMGNLKKMMDADEVYIELEDSLGERWYIKSREGHQGLWHQFMNVGD